MSERPTPETDEIAESLLYEKADKRDYELRQHARRLECERDAERALADRLAEVLEYYYSEDSRNQKPETRNQKPET